jgi:uncharacterized protein YxjI
VRRTPEELMPVTVTCECTNEFTLKDEFAGRTVKCPSCGAAVRAGATTFTPDSSADPIFARDVFLLRQKALRINESYDVCDESGTRLVFVERPRHFFRNLGALLAGAVAAIVWLSAFVAMADAAGQGALANVLGIVGFVGALVALIGVGVALSAKRHVTFYTGEDRAQPILEVLQDRKLQLVYATYTVRDAGGIEIARFRKNFLFNFFRRKWEVLTPSGAPQWIAREDSIILSLLRRFLGPMLGLLRTNFIFQRAGGDRVIGEFKRKLTILDRYVLDLRPDGARAFDRRVALALGVMLDTGERR